MQKGRSIQEICVGDKASFSKVISERDVIAFAEISGDDNPVHLDAEYAAHTVFKERIAHGILSAGLISAVLGTRLPGVGTIYLSQSLKFTAPVKLGDVVQAEVEVIERIVEKNRLKLRTICRKQDGTVVIEGEAVVMPPK